MKPRTAFQRFLLGAAAALIIMIIGFAWVSRLIPTWGSTAEEAARALPADELVPEPDFFWNHAITIRAPAEQVYPWLVQMGDSRAAFYSITFIENAFCAMSGDCRYVNADQVRPEWQSPVKGQQGIIMDYMVIQDYQPGQWVLAVPSDKMPLQWTWLWYVQPVDAGSSRLIVRHRIAFPPDAPPAVMKAVFDAGYVMERGMMLGIRARAEGARPGAWEEALGALIWLLVLGMGIASAVRYVRKGDGYHTLGVGIEAIIVLFVLTYIQPPLLVRVLLALLVASGIWITFNRKQSRRWFAAWKKSIRRLRPG
jgi:hypothetical protein